MSFATTASVDAPQLSLRAVPLTSHGTGARTVECQVGHCALCRLTHSGRFSARWPAVALFCV
eukprot:8117252-Lingulodinium_polyedra.AAC.1